jgi:hypothetical protein
MGHRHRNICIFPLYLSDTTGFPYIASVDTRSGIMNNLPGDLRICRGVKYLVIGHYSAYETGGSGLVVCDIEKRKFFSYGAWFWHESILIKRYSEKKHKIRDLRY